MGQSDRNTASLLGIIGGILMLVAGVTGAAAWEALGAAVVTLMGSDDLVGIFKILVLLGSLGGIMVIFGSLVLRNKDRVSIGKLLITIGAGMGLIGMLIFLIASLQEIADSKVMFFMSLGLGFFGILLSIIARQKAD